MKFCTFSVDDRTLFGCQISSDRVVDLREAGNRLLQDGSISSSSKKHLDSSNLRDWLAGGEEALELASQICDQCEEAGDQSGVYSREKIRFQAPIQNPQKIICIGLNYRDHAEEQNVPLPERPLIFAKFPSTLIGPEDPIRLPSISQQVDPEAELCIVMLAGGRGISEERAKTSTAYMVGNDVSARDLQFSDKQWVRGKSCDTFAPCGPYIVTHDEVGDPHNLKIELKLNGNVQQSSNTDNLIFNCYELVSFISEAITLEPGDIIFTGTPSGVGVFRDPPVFLKSGDSVEVTIDKLGTLRNPVVSG